MEQAREEIKKKSAPVVPEEVKRGLKLMTLIKRSELAKKFIKSNYIISEYKSDPIIKSFLLFREFDEEYSILFTTNKIKISTPSDRRNSSDYRLKLSELYNKIRHIDNQYREYFSTSELYHETEEDKPVSQNQYYHYSKRLTELEADLKKRSRDIRNDLKNYFEAIINLFEELHKDMEGQQKIVINPQEEIDLDYELEGNKKLKGKKIYQALLEVIDFSYAFVFRLSSGNDLSESRINKEDVPAQNLSGKTETPSQEEKTETTSATVGTEDIPDQSGSIISELENFL